MKPIRVLQIGLDTNRGGIETIVYNWWKNIPKDEVVFDFLNVWNKPIAFQDEFEAEGSKILYKTLRRKNPRKSYQELKEIIEKGKYDYIHCHVMSLSEPEVVEIVNKYSNSKVIIHSHTTATRKEMSLKRYALHLYGKRKLKKYTYLKLACGTVAGRNMFGTNDFEIIENGINKAKFVFSEEYRIEKRKKFGIKEDEFVIGHVGRAGKPKNYPFIIKTFAAFSKKHNAKLFLLGNVDTDETVQKLIDDYNIRSNVICTGNVSDVYKFYSAMDVFFLPSLYEGVSVSLIEAQSTGLPCVVSKNVPTDSKVSELVDFVDIDSCDEAIISLEKAKNKENTDRKNAVIAENVDICNSAKKLLEFYKENM